MARASHTSKVDADRVRGVKQRANDRHRVDASTALTEKQVTVRLLDTYHKSGEARGFRIESDEPHAVGGEDLAPQPTEYMLLSLGFCQMSIIVSYAATMRVELQDVVICVTGHRDDRGLRGSADVRPGYYLIEVETELVSDESAERLSKLVALTESRCPVFDNLSSPTPMRNRVRRGGELVREFESPYPVRKEDG